MLTYRLEKTIPPSRKLVITGLPFQTGDKVEVVVRSRQQEQTCQERYPLRDKPVRYIDPFAGVAEGEWEVLDGRA